VAQKLFAPIADRFSISRCPAVDEFLLDHIERLFTRLSFALKLAIAGDPPRPERPRIGRASFCGLTLTG
jgi:hypothetical protein